MHHINDLLEQYMSNVPKTHRLEFSVTQLLQATDAQYRLVSEPSGAADGTRRVTAAISFGYGNRAIAFRVSPWMHSDVGMVTIFYRRQDPKESEGIGKLIRILDSFNIQYTNKRMSK